jgi:broad specificity phosphatase PhoE
MTSTTTLYLLRHPETTWNAVSRYQGHLDPPLSERGEQQMSAVLSLITPGSFDAIYSSPLSRAYVLAQALSERARAPLCTDDRLIEIHQGLWQGLYRHEIKARYPELFRLWFERPDYVTFPGGESLSQVADRVQAFLSSSFAAHPGQHIAAVTHDVIVKVAIMLTLGLELRYLHRFHLHNASISILCGKEQRRIVEAVDITAHLTGSPLAVPW